ncbi:MAG: GNAT family N-acetyltransferase, partial [Acidimicrobiia bacterium]|nr:GNAT family N-acetyltransferase [Acidimicrobiia bacterium]
MGVSVEEAHAVDDDLLDAFGRLTPQLSRSNPPPTAAELGEIVRSEASHLLIARDEG